jgi:hypothetical protein
MHPAIRHWTLLLAIAAVCITGCRGANPFGHYVQVTKEADSQLSEVEPPPQRLVTAKPRSESASTAEIGPVEDSPHVNRTTSARPPVDATTSAPAQRTLSDRDPNQAVAQTQPPTAAESSDVVVGDLSEIDSDGLMEAFRDYPPEVQREALRRLVAATSRRANQTALPNSIDLMGEVDDLPVLPEAKNTSPEVPPTRIASEPAADVAAVAINEIDSSQGDAQSESAELVTTEVEAADTQVRPSEKRSSDVVKAVSASRDETNPGMVKRAAIDSSLSIDLDPITLANQLSDQALYSSLLKRLATPVDGESEADRVSRLVRLRHLMVLSGDPDRAVEAIEGMPRAEQEFLRHQLLALWTMIDPKGHPVSSRRFTSALPQIREAAKFAAAASDSLEVRSLSFCTEIESYGQITKFPENRFDSGQQVILYCEIENFTVNQKDEGFETHLQGSYDIYNESNEKVVSQLLPADQQVSANYLRDYFIAYQMHLPAQLPSGAYRLQLTMEDVAGKKYGQSSVAFAIGE